MTKRRVEPKPEPASKASRAGRRAAVVRKPAADAKAMIVEAAVAPAVPLVESPADPAARLLDVLTDQDAALDQARAHWWEGDWSALAELAGDQLERHPQRDRLALLAAAGFHAQGMIDQARHYCDLAQQWGVSPRLTARVLIGGVHNTLGRAAAIDGDDVIRVHHHFSAAVASAVSGPSERLVTPIRQQEQLRQLGLDNLRSEDPLAAGSAQGSNREFDLPAGREAADTAAQIRALHKRIDLMERRVIDELHATEQLRAALEKRVAPSLPRLPEVGAAYAHQLMGLLGGAHDLVIDVGGHCAALIADLSSARVRAGEASCSRRLLVIGARLDGQGDHPLFAETEFCVAPAAPCMMPDGGLVEFFDCERVLLAQALRVPPAERVLVVFAAPEMAARPLVPLLLRYFRNARIDLLAVPIDAACLQVWREAAEAGGRRLEVRSLDALDGRLVAVIDSPVSPATQGYGYPFAQHQD